MALHQLSKPLFLLKPINYHILAPVVHWVGHPDSTRSLLDECQNCELPD